MQINSTLSNSATLEIEWPIEKKLSALDVEYRLVDAFQNLRFDEVKELVLNGGNPNQRVPLSKPYLVAFAQKVFVPEGLEGEISPDNPFLQTAFLLQNNEQYASLWIDEFFNGVVYHPMLLLATLIRDEELALFLLEHGAQGEFLIGEEDPIRLNVLEFASRISLPCLAEYALNQLHMNPYANQGEGTLSPFSIALLEQNFEILRLFIEHDPKVDLSLFQLPEFAALWNSEKYDSTRALLEELHVEVPILVEASSNGEPLA